MDNKDVEGAMNGIVDFIAMMWNDILLPVIKGIGALIDMLPPVAVGIIAGVLGLVWLYRKAKSG